MSEFGHVFKCGGHALGLTLGTHGFTFIWTILLKILLKKIYFYYVFFLLCVFMYIYVRPEDFRASRTGVTGVH